MTSSCEQSNIWITNMKQQKRIFEDKCEILQRIPISPSGMYKSITMNESFLIENQLSDKRS